MFDYLNPLSSFDSSKLNGADAMQMTVQQRVDELKDKAREGGYEDAFNDYRREIISLFNQGYSVDYVYNYILSLLTY